MTPDTRKVIMASARKIIADASDLKRENLRHDFIVEAATILRLCEVEDAWPNGCHDPDSCAHHKACMYIKCRNNGRDIAGEVEAAVTPADGGGK